MSYPCVDLDDFEMVDGTHLRPRDHMQWRHVALNYANAVIQSFPPNDGTAKDVALHTVQAQWTNTTPRPQYAYALLTRAGGRMALQSQSSAFIQISAGQTSGVSPADPSSLTVISKFGIGYARGATAANDAYYGVIETRMGDRTMIIGDRVLLAPGETVKYRAALRFISEYWEHRPIQQGDSETEAEVDTGESQIDIFAYPAIS
ncbi:DUF7172 family protein [Rhodococcus rhodochrous]|uniref:DUF7172 family protein n=1 Tax=Rhodococcus rhodochrous TaxID=1829 RepID=UPI001E5BA449|nr:hypothetical protein [Rhodococcus rhodochrous]